jgi:hypothetical protein
MLLNFFLISCMEFHGISWNFLELGILWIFFLVDILLSIPPTVLRGGPKGRFPKGGLPPALYM